MERREPRSRVGWVVVVVCISVIEGSRVSVVEERVEGS